VAISALAGKVTKGESAFSRMLLIVSSHGTGQAFMAVSTGWFWVGWVGVRLVAWVMRFDLLRGD